MIHRTEYEVIPPRTRDIPTTKWGDMKTGECMVLPHYVKYIYMKVGSKSSVNFLATTGQCIGFEGEKWDYDRAVVVISAALTFNLSQVKGEIV